MYFNEYRYLAYLITDDSRYWSERSWIELNKSLLRIRDILVWIRIRIRDPFIWLLDTDPDPTPDPTSFFSDFKGAKKMFSSFFSYTGTLSSVLEI